jgi:hypothetical protein
MVIEGSGVIAGETGIVPDTVYGSHVMPLLLNTFSTTNKISHYLGSEKPESVWYFSGEKYDLFWSHINTEYGMMIITNPVTQNNDLTWVLTTVDLAIQEVSEIIESLSKETKPDKKAAPKSKAKTKEEKPDSAKKTSSKAEKATLPKDTPKGSNGSAKKGTKAATKKMAVPDEEAALVEGDENEVHEFWKAATLEEEISRIDSPDSLSFEQAQKLGFIPGSDS